MSVFTETFDKTAPAGGDIASQGDDVIRDLAYSIQERLTLEHCALDSAESGATTIESTNAQGRHRPGRTSAVYIGTTVQIAALTLMTNGCMAYNTTTGQLLIYHTSSGWATYPISAPTATGKLAFAAYNTVQYASASGFTLAVCDEEYWDYGSCYTKTVTYKYTPTVAGLYQVNAYVAIDAGKQIMCCLYKNGALSVRGSSTGAAISTTDLVTAGSWLVQMNGTTDYIQMYLYSDSNVNVLQYGAVWSGYLVGTT